MKRDGEAALDLAPQAAVVAGDQAANDPDGIAKSAERVAPAQTGALPSSANKSPYPPLATEPTQLGAEDIRFDFNDGCRVRLPPRQRGSWRVRLQDLDTGNVLFLTENKGALIRSTKRWYVRFRIEVWELEEAGSETPRLVLAHDFDLTGKEVLIQFPIGTLGDSLALFSYCSRFA